MAGDEGVGDAMKESRGLPENWDINERTVGLKWAQLAGRPPGRKEMIVMAVRLAKRSKLLEQPAGRTPSA